VRESESGNCTHRYRAGTFTRLTPLIPFLVRKNTRKTSMLYTVSIEFHREVIYLYIVEVQQDNEIRCSQAHERQSNGRFKKTG
jgi:hypothetical protein